MKSSGTRKPPSRACGEEQVINAVAVKVAHGVVAECVSLDDVVGANLDVVARVEMNGIQMDKIGSPAPF